MDFKNEYYKEILKKRIKAYEFIERQIAVMKTVVLDKTDGKPYHLILSEDENTFHEFQKDLGLAISYSLWIDGKTSKTLDELNQLFYEINNLIIDKSKSEVENIGKQYYQSIADYRIRLELDLKKGLYDLHDVKKIFKEKRRNTKRIFQI